MRVRVGPLEYEVVLVAGYVRHEGEDCLGLCDNEQQVLSISDRTTAAQRVAIFCHEYMEAWLYHFGGEEKSKEGYCDLFGLAMAQFIQQFAPGFALDESALGRAVEQSAGGGDHEPGAVKSIGMRVTERIVPPEPDSDGKAWRVRLVEPDPPDPRK